METQCFSRTCFAITICNVHEPYSQGSRQKVHHKLHPVPVLADSEMAINDHQWHDRQWHDQREPVFASPEVNEITTAWAIVQDRASEQKQRNATIKLGQRKCNEQAWATKQQNQDSLGNENMQRSSAFTGGEQKCFQGIVKNDRP